MTLIRVPPHCDFEQGTGHYHEEQEELYLVTRGTLTMRFGDDIRHVAAGSVVRVAPRTPRSHRNEGDEPVEMWALSTRTDGLRRGQARRLLGGVAGRRAGAAPRLSRGYSSSPSPLGRRNSSRAAKAVSAKSENTPSTPSS